MMITLENDKLVSCIMLVGEVDILNIELRLVLYLQFHARFNTLMKSNIKYFFFLLIYNRSIILLQ